MLLIQKIKDAPTRLWYARQTLEQGWSHDTLGAMIRSQAHNRQGSAVTNFPGRMPQEHSAMAAGLLKDPYVFDFLTLAEPFRGARVGNRPRPPSRKIPAGTGTRLRLRRAAISLEVSDKEFFLDLLFYHLGLRCFVVVDLKRGDFKRSMPAR